MRELRIGCVLVVVAAVMGGCERPSGSGDKSSSGNTGSGAKAAALPADLFVKSEPADAKSVLEVKVDAKAGDAIVISGRIGGSTDPFVAERAMFTIVDKSIPFCGQVSKEDTCKTPWDYCCEPADRLANHSATIQVVGADGRPLKTGLSNVAALKPTNEVVVKGKVAQKEGSKILVVNAESIFVKG